MATFTVTTAADDGAGSLRAAVSAANALTGEDVIAFDAAVFDGGPEDLIRLTSGQIEILDGLMITGGPAGVTITGDANGDDVTLAGGITDVAASLEGEDRLDDNNRIFESTAALTLDGLTLTGGRTIANRAGGGAVRGTNVTLTNSTVSGNSAAGDYSGGGGIFGGYGVVTLINSTVSDNSTAGEDSGGGGVLSFGSVTLIDSTVSGNSTAGDGSSGGGVRGGYNGDYGTEGGVTLTNSTVSDNSTAGDGSDGGGVWGADVVTLTNSTVSGNDTVGDESDGGGISSVFMVRLTNSTVSGNVAAGEGSEGGGVYGAYGDITLTNSLVLGNATVFAGVDGDEVRGDLALTGGNILGGDLFDGETDVGDVTAADVFAATTEIAPGVLAGALADNGGPTQTILIAADGPAVDAGGATALPIDQRGWERVVGEAVDLGAVESCAGLAEPRSRVVTTARDVVANDGLTSLREAVFFANLELGTDTITFDASVFNGEVGDVIRLTGGQIDITEALTIVGGPSGVTITGDAAGDDVTRGGEITDVGASLEGEDRLDDNNRIFDATAALTLYGLALTGGRTTAEGEYGGAVRGDTTVTLIDSMVSGNSTEGDFSLGGGVFGLRVRLINSTVSGNRTAGFSSEGGGVGSGYRGDYGGIYGGDVTLTNSTVSDNSTAGDSSYGGGVFGGEVTLTDSTVSGNSTVGRFSDGGGIDGFDVTLTNSTVSGNSTAGDYSRGGGVRGSVTLTNSTVSGNSTAGDGSGGGGIYGFDVMLTSSTVSGNSTAGDASQGGGIDGGLYGGVTLNNSLVLGNATLFAGMNGDEVGGDLILTGGNILGGDLFDGETDVGDVTAAEVFAATTEIAPGVRAGVLADNGGPTRTILIAADGPAVDAGGATALPTDQRGLARLFGEAVDLGAVESGAGPAEPGSLIVTTALDVVANDGLISLREAVLFANLKQGTDTITFDAGVFDGEARDVIRLTNGQIATTEALILEGGPSGVTITGDASGDDVTRAGEITDVSASLEGEDRLDDNSRIFDATADLTFDGLTLTGGRTMANAERGGAVRGATVTLTNSTVSGNSTAGDFSNGGAVSGSDVTLTNSTVSGNSVAGEYSDGGGVSGGYVTLTNSTISSNNTTGDFSAGGGIRGGYVTLTNSTVSGNSTAGVYSSGGGVNSFDVTLTNSTVSGNSTTGNDSDGGGIRGREVALMNSTVSGNSTAGEGSEGGGVSGGYGGYYGGYDPVTLTNSIVLGNATIFAGVNGDEVEGEWILTGSNILGSDILANEADVGDVTAAEVFAATTEIAPGVLAGVLGDNGGPAPTIAIRADGPAAGAADPETALSTDQRGLSRDAAPDLGAFEAGAEDGLQLFGGPAADVLVSGAGDDRIWGRGGNDTLRGLAGDDLLRGGNGSDRLEGGGGADLLRGGKGRDQICGKAGEDVILGGWGRDRIDGGAGDDLLSGGKGRDVFVFAPDSDPDPSADTIVGFDANPHWGQDRMDLSALGISAASFAGAVTIERIGDDTRITLQGGGSILCTGIDGEGVTVIDQSDFLLLA